MRFLTCVLGACAALAACAAGGTATAAEFNRNGHVFTVPDGLSVELVARSPLVERPVSADFDEHGRLYVTDSSGSNEPVEVQRQKRPHRVLQLSDIDGDGTFDKSTVFADKLMFPEGALWFDGSLYVAAPPEIWKFTDDDDDGVADRREVWFDGQTLTHCANDLHGPYLGLDGWIYWCKGAFATQTYERSGRSPLTTKAAHIFRRRPEGGPLEMVMTGGMDNPVEVVFTPGGERLFTTTFLVHPQQGQRDGLLHAVYGGAYGKDHGALEGHPRTGELMPVLAHLGAAAPCGLARLESDGLGAAYRDNVLACLFNMHKITRHQLTPNGATFAAETSDLLVSDNLDFHPTDVLEDADGSLLVVDTGGWFRLCCPTSQIEKPDVLGGIYRVRRADAKPPADPRGREIAWDTLDATQLTGLLGDSRFTVRNQARQRIARHGPTAVAALRGSLQRSTDAAERRQAVWALTWIAGAEARAAVREAVSDPDDTVRQAALHSISVRRDRGAAATLADVIRQGAPHNRRAAAEALGRVGIAADIPRLLAAVATVPAAEQPAAAADDRLAGDRNGAADSPPDRFLEHSLIYAAIELGDPAAARSSLDSPDARVRRAAWIALDQMEGGHLRPADIAPSLTSDNTVLRNAAWWIAERHPDWGDEVAEAFRIELQASREKLAAQPQLAERLARFAKAAGIQQIMAEALQAASAHEPLRLTVMKAMALSNQKPLPAVWLPPLRAQLSESPAAVNAALQVLSQLGGSTDPALTKQLNHVATDERRDAALRLRALHSLPAGSRPITEQTLAFLCGQLRLEPPGPADRGDAVSRVGNRSLAVEILSSAKLDSKQLQMVAGELPRTGALELQPLLTMFAKSKDAEVGAALVASLLITPAATALFPDRLEEQLAGFGESVAAQAKPLLASIQSENEGKVRRMQEILDHLPTADLRRGLRVFQSAKASCIACHVRGYLGGRIGPDLNRIGKIRSERDLLESILFPSLTFVRNFEPVSIALEDGRVLNGVIRDETAEALTLQLDAQKFEQIDKSAIVKQKPGDVSIMPAGLEKQLTPQELADLIKYLKEG